MARFSTFRKARSGFSTLRMLSKLAAGEKLIWTRVIRKTCLKELVAASVVLDQLNSYHGQIGKGSAIEMVVRSEQPVATFESMSSD